jgi:hypothetical protein
MMSVQTKIKSILIENVRGISAREFVFDNPEMIGNKFHLLVAPNGFGKSSLAGAFRSLKPRSLYIPPSLLHKNKEENKAKLQITYSVNGTEQTVLADENTNEISKVFSISVINSKLMPKAAARTGFNVHAKPKASLIIEPVTLVEKVPVNPGSPFSTSGFKDEFGDCWKILTNIKSLLENELFLNGLLSLPAISAFSRKTVWNKLDKIFEDIKSERGTAVQIIGWIRANKLADLLAVSELVEIMELVSNFSDADEVDRILVAYQFARFYHKDSKLMLSIRDWQNYASSKKRCDELLKQTNSNPEWISVSVIQTKGKLIADFPEAITMSNGQRDLLSFVAQLMKAEFEMAGARAILIVDEVFDYLDECNLLAAQYFVSKFVERFKSNGAEIFPLFLTHLDPNVFKHSALGLGKKDIRKIHFLDRSSDSSRTEGIAKMVKHRNEEDLRPFIGKYFFHYHPHNCNQELLFTSHSMKKAWGQSHNFYKYIFAELRKYLSSDIETDFVAAGAATRIAIEKHAFDQLTDADQARQFTDEFDKGTNDKLDFVERLGHVVPESHRLLGLLYNDILHHKDHFDYISAIVSKMKNPAIRSMINEIPIPSEFS